MQKIYLLLRNNQQSGPFSIDELLQHSLKNDDLIWVEDQSAGWSYPSEVESLKPFLQPSSASGTKGFKKVDTSLNQDTSSSSGKDPNKKKSSKHIFIRLPEGRNNKKPTAETPATDLEQKAAALKEKVLSLSEGNREGLENDEVQTNYARTLSDVEAEYTSWVYKKKVSNKQQSGKKQLAYMVAAIVGVSIAFFVVKHFTNSGGAEASVVEYADGENSAVISNEREDSTYDYANVSRVEDYTTKSNDDNNSTTATLKEKKTTSEKEPAQPVQNGKEKGQELEPKKVLNETPEQTNAAGEARGNKKSIGQKIEGIIDKLKGGKEKETTTKVPVEAQTPATVNNEVADLSKNVVLSSNQTAANNWMLGIKGLKVTMKNKGVEPIKAASVAVRYYNEEKELMETKIIHFTNVGGGKKVTVSAPDHRLASFTDYVLLSANN